MADYIDKEAMRKAIREQERLRGLKGLGWVEAAMDRLLSLTPPNDWISVEDRLPEPGERVLATDCGFVGEFYINKRGKWQRYNVNCSELLMALDILYWMPLPKSPKEDE